ncbi:hypothetical protein AVEN_62653-1 [Araneus ventricosus]|uniref:Uncharacterized protein n=1 Tax=Araneus ventricosus TaxID=182803 RepID=A0A4Y2MF13_ARAVE|nr:hypothetical protein AVEN_62653-1 [Araneus ventricosus]
MLSKCIYVKKAGVERVTKLSMRGETKIGPRRHAPPRSPTDGSYYLALEFTSPSDMPCDDSLEPIPLESPSGKLTT